MNDRVNSISRVYAGSPAHLFGSDDDYIAPDAWKQGRPMPIGWMLRCTTRFSQPADFMDCEAAQKNQLSPSQSAQIAASFLTQDQGGEFFDEFDFTHVAPAIAEFSNAFYAELTRQKKNPAEFYAHALSANVSRWRPNNLDSDHLLAREIEIARTWVRDLPIDQRNAIHAQLCTMDPETAKDVFSAECTPADAGFVCDALPPPPRQALAASA